MRQLGESMKVDNVPQSRGLIDKVKEMFS
jgi:hypothetical protein